VNVRRNSTLALLALTLAGLVLPAAAGAARTKLVSAVTTTTLGTLDCVEPSLTQPFSGFGDLRFYTLAPGGHFETGAAGWTLTAGAAVAPGNEPWYLRSGADRYSLQLPPGAVATSPPMCVTLDYPIFRLPVQSLDPSGQTDLVVEVRYPDAADASWKGVRTESGKSADGWRLTSDIDLKPDTYGSSNEWRNVQLRFAAKGIAGDPGWRVDDVFVDPYMRR
jgi:hypothetical protein